MCTICKKVILMTRHLNTVHKLAKEQAQQWRYNPRMGGTARKSKNPVSRFMIFRTKLINKNQICLYTNNDNTLLFETILKYDCLFQVRKCPVMGCLSENINLGQHLMKSHKLAQGSSTYLEYMQQAGCYKAAAFNKRKRK
jgi:hypothetical protein